MTHITFTIMYYVYLLRSKVDKSLYVGCTADLQDRFHLHNKGKVFSTRNKRPWQLLYYEAFVSKKDAFRREASLKLHAQGLRRLKERLSDSLSESYVCHE